MREEPDLPDVANPPSPGTLVPLLMRICEAIGLQRRDAVVIGTALWGGQGNESLQGHGDSPHSAASTNPHHHQQALSPPPALPQNT